MFLHIRKNERVESVHQDDQMLIGGVDEVGRGCLYGNVVAAVVVMPPVETLGDDTWKQIKDSKKLTPKKRKQLDEYIRRVAITYGIGSASVEEIDEHNILQATMMAMHRAIEVAYQKHAFDILHVDGTYFKPYRPTGATANLPSACIVGGDASDIGISAASIIAKEYRDAHIQDLVSIHPSHEVYGLKTNMGYGTPKHLEALRVHGMTEYHRKTFAPMNTML